MSHNGYYANYDLPHRQQLVSSEQELHALARSAETTEKAIAVSMVLVLCYRPTNCMYRQDAKSLQGCRMFVCVRCHHVRYVFG